MLIKIVIPAIAGLACAFNANAQPRFTPQVLDSTVSIGYGIALADVDGDGKPDILLADKKQFVWYRNGDWKKFVMAENLTEFDNVCIAARDIDGDGKAEVAVGAQWNPGETSNAQQSGSVHYLIRPQDPTTLWKPVELHHEPTIHRMQWVRAASGQFYLVVTPLHGVGNKNGQGAGVRILAYHFNGAPDGAWVTDMIDSSMHMTHNFFTVENDSGTGLYVAGKEGIVLFQESGGTLVRNNLQLPGMKQGAGEISMGKTKDHENFIATIEPMHGNELVVYSGKAMERMLLDSNLKEGHALVSAIFYNGAMTR